MGDNDPWPPFKRRLVEGETKLYSSSTLLVLIQQQLPQNGAPETQPLLAPFKSPKPMSSMSNLSGLTIQPFEIDKRLVYVSESSYGPPVWLVYNQVTAVEAEGRAVHRYPVDHYELTKDFLIQIRSPWKEDRLFPLPINPRKLLRPGQLDNLREQFPRAVGVQVFVSGFLIVLFKSNLTSGIFITETG